jgi:intergrase/recombinase
LLPTELSAEDLVRVIKKEHANGAELYVLNDGIVDATVSFKLELNNARVDNRKRTFILGPGEQVRAFTVTRRKTDKP